ncbi:hypothetical protein OKW24_004425 [Peribacillus simplex]|nr:hypothetical protein [Peribacillus simplex]
MFLCAVYLFSFLQFSFSNYTSTGKNILYCLVMIIYKYTFLGRGYVYDSL